MPRLGRFVALACGLSSFAISGSASAVPLFEAAPGAFDQQPCGGGGCWTNYLRVTDIDQDGDLDILFPNYSGFFTMGSPQPFAVYRNDGNASFTDISATAVAGHSARLRQVAVGDVDGDGDLDIYAPDGWGDSPDAFFINDGSGSYVDEADVRLPGVSSNAGAVRFGDVDSDGDLDLLVADGYAQQKPAVAHLYTNDGAGMFTDDSAGLPTTKEGVDPDDFDLLDADNDFDLDLLINMHQGKSSLWLNDGAGGFTDATNQLASQAGSAFHYGPGVCDVDGDGDLDIWTDNVGPGYGEQLLINDGQANFADETAQRVMGNSGADDNGVACADVDGDGDLDAIVASLSDVERVLENDGGGNFTAVADAFPAVSDPTLWIELGDLDGDGRLDAVTGQGEGNPELNRVYLGNSNAPVDDVAPVIRAFESVAEPVAADAEPVVRFAISDGAVTDEGPRLEQAFMRVTVDGQDTDVGAGFMGGDLFRAVLPGQAEGTTVEYAACARDAQGNEGCATPQSYQVEGVAGTDSTSGTDDATATATATDSSGTDSTDPTESGPESDTSATDDGDSGGCGCGMARERRPGGAILGAMLLALLIRRRESAV